jgi:hypothetical protein
MHARALATGEAPPVHNPAESGLWNGCCRFFRVVWVSRVSVVSLAFGFFLMWSVPQAQDVFAEHNPNPLYWPLFFLVLAFGWAFPVHFASRWILRRGLRVLEPESLPYMDKREEERVLALYAPFVTWVPRVLGVLCFAAVAIGIWKARANLAPAADLPVVGRSVGQLTVLFWADIAVAILFTVFLVLRRDIITAWRQRRLPDPELRSDVLRSDETPAWDSERALGYAYVLLLSLAWVAAVAFPIELVTRVYRAMFLTVMLGAPVFALTWVAYKSHVTRAPLILALVIVCALVSLASLHAHDLRVLATKPEAPATRQLRLDQAVAAWRRSNGCEGGAACPSPIIVTGQGGASRAAFFTASTLGQLLDESPKDAQGRPQFAKQLFALSTVSGSSLGAIAVRAALDEARDGFRPPCTQWTPLWHGRYPVEGPPRDPRTSWRDCLQLLVSGDYLSPTFVGLAFRDNISIPWGDRPLWADRATILERAWENHYRRVTGRASAGEPVGLERPFGYHPAARAGDRWSPLLFLNGSAVGSGRRVVAADILPWTCLDEDGTARPWAVYSEAFDLFEILGSDTPNLVYERSCAGGVPERGEAAADVALSTAATVSARFPIVSPPGTLRLKSGEVFEHVVDGGYFDNDGLMTARDIAVLLRRSGLVPTILRITNEPSSAPPRPKAADPAAPAPPPDRASIPRPAGPEETTGGFLISFVSPVTGLYNTRAGHGSEAAREAIECVDDREGPSEYLHLAVFPSPPLADGDTAKKPDAPVFIENVSMSWWLSQPVQAYLERQTGLPENQPALKTLFARLDPAATAPPPAVPGCYALPARE